MITFLTIIIVVLALAIVSPALSDFVCDTPRIVEAPAPRLTHDAAGYYVARSPRRPRRPRTLGEVADHPDFRTWAFA